MVDTDVGDRDFDVVVIGAGFAGLYMLHRLRGLGMSAVVLEQAGGVGGTWYWNRYPGARCDSESYYYCYSFDRELEQEWTWTERYPRQPEIKAYLDHVADRFDLRRDIRFSTTVTGARADADGRGWTVSVQEGTDLHCRFLVTAVGCLSAANVPDLPGLETFAGRWFHTGRWPHEGVDVTGRRVGVVGTGSTGIQAIPVLAREAAHLTVLQRTPNYSVPARNGPLSKAESRSYKADYTDIRAVQAASANGHPFVVNPQSALEVDAAERDGVYRAAWERGGLRFRASYRDLLADEAANETASEFVRDRIREIVRDPETAARLLPHDHGFATKRPPIDTGYFETYNRDDVTLVDVRADPVEAVVPEGLRLRSGAVHELDDIVFATGFDALTGPLLRLDPTGPDGTSLRSAWRDGPRTYLGLAVSGFPNLFTITGPFSPSVLTNMPSSIEQHVDWIAGCLAHLRATGADRIEADPGAEQAWGEHNREAADATLLPRAATSWYLGANVPGKPSVFMPYAGGFARYAGTCADVARDGYRGFRLGHRRAVA
ncbi:cyclohexanone monooxygenase [Pseudonocardia sp. EC080610-09]|uniref:flavin-containing monooxygenase n=1 Tax=unclassified Pseudonocardia TaxID=2619320 RepID=UPI0006CB3BCE|nr:MULTISPECIES: NAD(P)/FAD-dependent oxidoreductase [unclassified Pseudonocardia]ALE72366.1 cyclohexanone monooxygenase [Pseudonocardia sp. EC080625-04]ALL75659.1 cyclohexanone monooxygenase [Pseudonocardia sp. EC080610-09]ALL82687.1 cyclohexanone monooxygenase [Pseudonocardia sp. EC080619-01]